MECSHNRHDETASQSADAAAVRRQHDSARLLEDPELKDDLRRARRLLRIDPPHDDLAPLGLAELLGSDGEASAVGQVFSPAGHGSHTRQTRRSSPRRTGGRRRSSRSATSRLRGAVTWLVVCAGGMALAFGAGLLVCAKLRLAGGLTSSDELSSWGLLTAVAGQFLLFLGMALRRSSGRMAPKGRSRGTDRSRADIEQPHARPSSAAPLWSPRCEAVLGLSLDTVD